MNNYNKNGGCDSSTRLKTSWFPHTKDYECHINFNDRLYTDIENLLKASDIKINDYLVGAIEDKFYTDKYGDLNEVLYKKEETIKEEPVKKEKMYQEKLLRK